MDKETLSKFKIWLSKNMHMAIDAKMVMTFVENIELKNKEIAFLTDELNRAKNNRYAETAYQKDIEIAQLKERLEAWREYWKMRDWGEFSIETDKLKSLGEI